jgi:hypothetical protein
MRTALRCVLMAIATAVYASLPAAQNWSVTGPQNEGSISGGAYQGRKDHVAVVLASGKVFIAGGNYNSSTIVSELYDPLTGLWTTTGGAIAALVRHTMTLLPNGKVLLTGGTENVTQLAHAGCLLYDPALGTWTSTGAMAFARVGHTATLLPNGRVLVLGGGNLPAEPRWASAGALPSLPCLPKCL